MTILRNSYPRIKIAIFSILYTQDVILDLLHKGACEYIYKSDSPVSIIYGLEQIMSRLFFTSKTVGNIQINRVTLKRLSGFSGQIHLTENEIMFIKMAACDQTYKKMANILRISPKTLENYREAVFKKLNLKNRAALVTYGYENGLLEILSKPFNSQLNK